jgi:SAM-dependent methyltransferase
MPLGPGGGHVKYETRSTKLANDNESQQPASNGKSKKKKKSGRNQHESESASSEDESAVMTDQSWRRIVASKQPQAAPMIKAQYPDPSVKAKQPNQKRANIQTDKSLHATQETLLARGWTGVSRLSIGDILRVLRDTGHLSDLPAFASVSDVSYWQAFYGYGDADAGENTGRGNTDIFEWYSGGDVVTNACLPLLRKGDRILNMGCGNSDIHRQLMDSAQCPPQVDFVNVDYVPEVIELMKRTQPSLADTFHVGDCTCMPEYATQSFDLVLDKGCLDALISGGEAAETGENEAVHKLMAEAGRVLKHGGLLLLVSFSDHQTILPYLYGGADDDLDWEEVSINEVSSATVSGGKAVKGGLKAKDIKVSGDQHFHIFIYRKL